MARIRTIKPEFPQSESIGRVSREARLLFIQLWTICDDSGRTRAASRMLASLLYPYDDDAKKLIPKWLDELAAEGCVRLYEVDGQHYLDIPKWLSHQRIDRPSPSKFPPFDEASRAIDEPSRKIALDQGREGNGEDGSRSAVARKTRLPENWKEDEGLIAYAREHGSADPADTFARFRLHHGSKGTLAVDWYKAAQYWCRNEKNFRRPEPQKLNGHSPPTSPEPWPQRMKFWRESEFWQPMWGPEPGQPGCLVPKQFLGNA